MNNIFYLGSFGRKNQDIIFGGQEPIKLLVVIDPDGGWSQIGVTLGSSSVDGSVVVAFVGDWDGCLCSCSCCD